ncbi:hypothetical protein HBI67_022210 [Parastagonospora nodorum]|nr:hypothetical protein HBI66_101290 [Parastagonospora nodorum]KAH6083343.1 hypothetical protein HBI67_022210 [Parastagonospora nodorum]KAH6431343.1 hypothetical protein HBI14_033270 [Parastagonospora nodorum]
MCRDRLNVRGCACCAVGPLGSSSRCMYEPGCLGRLTASGVRSGDEAMTTTIRGSFR